MSGINKVNDYVKGKNDFKGVKNWYRRIYIWSGLLAFSVALELLLILTIDKTKSCNLSMEECSLRNIYILLILVSFWSIIISVVAVISLALKKYLENFYGKN